MSRVIWTYYITRDSLAGDLSGKCHLWYIKPLRVKHSYRVTWVASDHRDHGHIGEYDLKEVSLWFRTLPETDLELIKVEMYPTAEQIAEHEAKTK